MKSADASRVFDQFTATLTTATRPREMVSAYRADALRDPTSELRELFAAHAAASDFPAEVSRHFSTVFSSEEAFAEVRYSMSDSGYYLNILL